MRGNDCNVTPEWWEPELPPLQAANLNHARDLVKHHSRLHPDRECRRQAAASAYITKAEQRADDDQPQGLLHRYDGSVAEFYPDGLVLDVVPPDDR